VETRRRRPSQQLIVGVLLDFDRRRLPSGQRGGFVSAAMPLILPGFWLATL
jgi:hypothetical protein